VTNEVFDPPKNLDTRYIRIPHSPSAMRYQTPALFTSPRGSRRRTAVHDDRVAWGELTDDATSGLSRLCDVVAQRRVVVASYQSKNGECSVRRLLPLGLVNKAVLTRAASSRREDGKAWISFIVGTRVSGSFSAAVHSRGEVVAGALLEVLELI